MPRMFLSLSFFFLVGLSAKSQPVPDWEKALEAGYAQMEQNDFEAALHFAEKWLSENATPEEGRAAFFTLKGNALRNLGQPEAAIENHQIAAQIRAGTFGPSSEEYANCLQNIANCFWDLADYESAFPFFEKNLSIRQEIYRADDRRLVLPLMNIGDAFFELGQVKKAESFFQNALEIEWKNGAGQSLNSAILRSDLANCFLQNGEHLRALDSLRQALIVFQNTPSDNPLEMGRCHQRMGHCHLERGDAESARRHYQSALLFLENSPSDLAPLHLEMARLFRFDGQYEKALEQLSGVVSAAEALPEKSKIRPRFLAAAWLQFGTCFLETGELDGAGFYLEKAVTEVENLPDREKSLASIFLKKGMLAEQKNDFIGAEKNHREALDLAEKTGDKSKQFAALRRLGILALKNGETSSALNYFSQGKKLLGTGEGFEYEKIQAQKSIAEALWEQAKMSGQKEDWEAVTESASEGIRMVSNLKGGFRNERAELDIQSDFFHLYNYAIGACARSGATEDAFHFTEDYRGNLARRLAQRPIENGVGKPSFATRLARVDEALASAQKRRFDLAGEASFSLRPEMLKEADSLIQTLVNQRDGLLDSLASVQPEAFNFWHQKQSLTSQEIRKNLTDGQTLLEYHWGESELFVFIFRPDTFQLETLPISENIRDDILTFFKACNQNPAWLPNGSPVELPRLGHRLYGQILAPVSDWLADEIIISPDAWLWYLPFEALLSRPAENEEAYWDFPFLIKEKTVSYVQSAQLFIRLKNTERSKSEGGLLALAPVFKKGTPGFKPLLHNVEEAQMASEILSGKCLTDTDASEENLKNLAAQFRMLLLSTHGVLDDRNAAWSHLALAPSKGENEYELLHAWEIHHLQMPAELVMLSACQTANGRMNRGEGLMSLVRAFHFAGAKTVVGSLWNVDDRQTPKLVESFLQKLKNGEPKNKALTLAKREYLTSANRLKTHPFFWAGFVFSGDVSKVEIVDRKMSWWVWAVGVLGLGLVGFWLLKRKN